MSSGLVEVEYLTDHGRRRAGDVRRVDPRSAASLEARGVARQRGGKVEPVPAPAAPPAPAPAPEAEDVDGT